MSELLFSKWEVYFLHPSVFFYTISNYLCLMRHNSFLLIGTPAPMLKLFHSGMVEIIACTGFIHLFSYIKVRIGERICRKMLFLLFLSSQVYSLCFIIQCYGQTLPLCCTSCTTVFCKDSWPSILCVKGFKAAKEIIVHAALSLQSKPQSVSTKRHSDKGTAILMISQR